MVRHIKVEKPLLKLDQQLGEACLWDPVSQRLYWADIQRAQVWTYEPASGIYGFEQFELKIAAFALFKSGKGFIASTSDGFVELPMSLFPFPPTYKPEEAASETLKAHHLDLIPCGVSVTELETRINDGAADPVGRYVSGSMSKEWGTFTGRVYQVVREGDGYKAKVVIDSAACGNGTGWTKDGKTMYFTDSWIPEISKFDYDVATGDMTNRRTFSSLPPEEYGEPDGLCMDAEDGVWSARWRAGKVVRFTPDGEIDIVIEFPTAWHMTCCVFGGPDLGDLYVSCANSGRGHRPHHQNPARQDGGSLFVVKGLGIKGVERGRFDA